VVICLERGADCLHMVQLMPLHPKTPSSLVSTKSRLVSPFWHWLAQVVLGPDLQNILRFIIRLSEVCRKIDLES